MSQPENISPTPERWYLPTWFERLTLMKWRVLYFVPVVLMLPLVCLFPWLLLFWWKILIIAVGVPISAAIRAAKNAIHLRKEPFCIHCGYDLTNLPDGHMCPECGLQFFLTEIDDYRRDPHWFIKRRQHYHPNPGGAIDAGPRRSRKPLDGT